jgi:hypothetical protein
MNDSLAKVLEKPPRLRRADGRSNVNVNGAAGAREPVGVEKYLTWFARYLLFVKL